MLRTGTITTYESGMDLVVEWKLQNFFTLSVSDDAYYYSRKFSFGGQWWYLGIFPNGWSQSDSSGHVDLRLRKCPSDRSIRLTVSLSLKTAKGEKYKEQHFAKDFQNIYPESYHELLRFIPRSELTIRKFELVPDDVLTVVCTIKNTASAKSYTGNDPEQVFVEPFTQHVEVSTQTVEECIQSVEASTQTVEECIQSVEASTQTVEEKCEASASGFSANPQEKKVLHDFKELFLNKKDCDVTIKVKGSEFLAHRIILIARSPALASTFGHDMKENATGILEIQDCDPSTFSDFLCFLYCGDVGIISQENVFGLFTVADKYQVLDLRAMCLEFMKKNITVDTFCETLTLALRHSETELIGLSTEFFKKNIPKIIMTVKWQTFLAENPTECNELLVKFFVSNSSLSKRYFV